MVQNYVPAADRLPWLADDRAPPKAGRIWPKLSVAMVMIAAIAAASYWFGAMRPEVPAPRAKTPTPSREVTAALPEPMRAGPANPVVRPAPMPDVTPAPLPAPVVLRQQRELRIAAERAAARQTPPRARAPARAAVADKEQDRKALQFSNPWESANASGRMVRVGTYASLSQGKRAWSRLARVYPGMKSLPAVVTDIKSMRDGRAYYRLQIGTTSQAHSEVLCQRMKAIGQSCVVVDLAGARRDNGDERQPVNI